eukprot:GEZU01012779.1.p1 GENE.GEZU01012779.1~~GEZU01012779.1.p1  ORF type:complete len:134 (-),score=40.49 GEZU01012779.1:95-496(-)
MTGDLYGLLNQVNWSIAKSPVSAAQLGSIIDLIEKGTISGKIGKDVLLAMFSGDKRLADEIVKEKGLAQVTDDSALRDLCKRVLLDNPNEVKRYKEGNQRLFRFFVGQVMKESKGKANPDQTNSILEEELRKM